GFIGDHSSSLASQKSPASGSLAIHRGRLEAGLFVSLLPARRPLWLEGLHRRNRLSWERLTQQGGRDGLVGVGHPVPPAPVAIAHLALLVDPAPTVLEDEPNVQRGMLHLDYEQPLAMLRSEEPDRLHDESVAQDKLRRPHAGLLWDRVRDSFVLMPHRDAACLQIGRYRLFEPAMELLVLRRALEVAKTRHDHFPSLGLVLVSSLRP